MGTEFQAKGSNVQLGPGTNIARVPVPPPLGRRGARAVAPSHVAVPAGCCANSGVWWLTTCSGKSI